MLNVTELARRCGLSRTTLLYYESVGLLKPSRRSAANYRQYSESDAARLRQVCAYRAAGLKIGDIREILSAPEGEAASVLARRFREIAAEIESLREHQRTLAKLLRYNLPTRRTEDVVTKEKFVSILRAAGLSDAEMHRFHTEFERNAPAEHQEFLEFLHIPAGEIAQIREASRKAAS